MNVIEYQNVSMAYGEKIVVKSLDLIVEKEELLSIIGGSWYENGKWIDYGC